MTDQQKLSLMSLEFENLNTTEERRVEILTELRDMAEESMPESRCLYCKHTGFYAPYDKALIEGHCYSEDGVRDYTRITRICEFCFDKIMADPDDEE